MGMVSICVALYRAPQIMECVNGAAGSTGGSGAACAEPGGAISGLLKAIGKQPMQGADLPALSLIGGAGAQAGSDASTLRIFGADSLSETDARRALEKAARQNPANALAGSKAGTTDTGNATKRLKQAPKVVVHKADEDVPR